jgi:hypothetical protein
MARLPLTQARNSIGPNYNFGGNKFLCWGGGMVSMFLFTIIHSHCGHGLNTLNEVSGPTDITTVVLIGDVWLEF